MMAKVELSDAAASPTFALPLPLCGGTDGLRKGGVVTCDVTPLRDSAFGGAVVRRGHGRPRRPIRAGILAASGIRGRARP